MTSHLEASNVIKITGYEFTKLNWTYFTGILSLLKLTREWRKNPPNNKILNDFKDVLKRPPPYFIKQDFTMLETVLTWSDLGMKEEDLYELIDNLFYFGLELKYDIDKFCHSENMLDFIPVVLAIGMKNKIKF